MSYSLVLNPPLAKLNKPVSLFIETSFVLIAAVLPAFVHTMGWNGAVLLPMHWTVLLAGLVFGPVGGFIAGGGSPLMSYFLSGLPALPVLFPMTLETITYGTMAGLFRKLKCNLYLSTLFSMLAGRIVYTLVFLALGRISGSLLMFWQKAFLPGLVSSLVMLLGLPLLAVLIVNSLKNTKSE
jgi:niacin transporter